MGHGGHLRFDDQRQRAGEGVCMLSTKTRLIIQFLKYSRRIPPQL
jgi:hypothetical protein